MNLFDLEAGTTDFYVDPVYYDHEFAKRTGDVAFYVDQYKDTEGPVLELAVGSGRIALKAVREGAEVVGIDLAWPMLRRAAERRAKLPKARRDKLHLLRADMRDFRLGRRFGLVTCPFNAFMHMYTREDAERCLAAVKRALAPGGMFIVDVLMPDLEYFMRSPHKRFPGVRFKHPTLGAHYTYSEQSAWDGVSQINQMWFHYDKADPDAPGPEHFVIQLSHRYYFPREMEALLHHAGFEVLYTLGDFEGGALTNDSDSMVWMCGHRR
ncbi:MAG: class I SAM-dependent methyltransferase [Myxococcales bacterium]|nr:class I SAM-dependent methyltransferase [Myxococcales bacterium]MCB9541533.1 class I SAM-dependent methyltransferase [Myxococcales bacterium]